MLFKNANLFRGFTSQSILIHASVCNMRKPAYTAILPEFLFSKQEELIKICIKFKNVNAFLHLQSQSASLQIGRLQFNKSDTLCKPAP